MNILFIHRSFPAQFKYIATLLSLDTNNNVIFLTADKELEIDGITKLVYTPKNQFERSTNPYLQNLEDAIIHGQAAAGVLLEMKHRDIKPDLIFSFSGWGTSVFIKDIFPNVPLLTYFEWYRDTKNLEFDLDGIPIDEATRGLLRCNNTHVLMSLNSCDAGISPTLWQKSQFPKEYQDKIKIIHDGIDTNYYMPDKNAKLSIKSENLEFTKDDEIITYGTRGMEPCRGFPEFMKAVNKLLEKRPNTHFVIAGDDISCYSENNTNESYKELMFKELDFNMNRVHFVGKLPIEEYRKFLQISSAHVYLTQPFVLSWSMLEAMATGCCVIGSNTEPVLEVIEDNINGLITEHSNIDDLVAKIEYALDNKDKMEKIRGNARNTIIEKYDISKTLPKQMALIHSLINK